MPLGKNRSHCSCKPAGGGGTLLLALVLALVVLVLAALVVGHCSATAVYYVHPQPNKLRSSNIQSGFLYTGRNSKFKFPTRCQPASQGAAKQRPQTTQHPHHPSQHPPVHFTWREPRHLLLLPRSRKRSRTDRTKQSLLKSAGENQAAMALMPATMPSIDQGETSQRKRTRVPSEREVGMVSHLKA